MYRGTTPTLYFKISNIDDFSKIKDIWVTIRNKEKILINKTLLNSEVRLNEDDSTVSIDLTQKETLSFKTPEVRTQIKVLFEDEKVSVSPIFTIKMKDILNSKEMTLDTPNEEEGE